MSFTQCISMQLILNVKGLISTLVVVLKKVNNNFFFTKSLLLKEIIYI